MQTENPGGAVQIGEWLVDPALDTITRGTATQKLEPRTMRLLLCLANSAGEVVSVDRLLTEVWSGVVVGSASVYQAVSQLRKLLGDVDPNPTYIATVPRKGYRLIAPVVQSGSTGARVPVAQAAGGNPVDEGEDGALDSGRHGAGRASRANRPPARMAAYRGCGDPDSNRLGLVHLDENARSQWIGTFRR